MKEFFQSIFTDNFWSSFLPQFISGFLLLLLGFIFGPRVIKSIIIQKHKGDGDNVGRDKIVYKNYNVPPPDKTTPSIPEKSIQTSDGKIKIIFKKNLGIVLPVEFHGTRLHVGVVLSNEHDLPIIIDKIWGSINNNKLFFKQFFKITNQGLRAPDHTQQLPVVIQSKNAVEYFFELENSENYYIKLDENFGEVFVQLNDKRIIKTEYKFIYQTSLEEQIRKTPLPSGIAAFVIEVPIEETY